MELEHIWMSDSAPEDVVQFVKHLEENLDPNNEFDCSVTIEVGTIDEWDLPSDELSLSIDAALQDYGVQVSVEFAENANAPSRQVVELAEGFYGQDEVSVESSFDGAAGTYNAYIFEAA